MPGILPLLADLGRFSNTTNELLAGLLGGGMCLGSAKLELDTDLSTPMPARPEGTKYALIIAEANASTVDTSRIIRYKMDGTDPDATNGMPMGDLTAIEVYYEANLANLRFIRLEAFTQSLQILFFG